MRIGFDAKRLFNNFTGLGNYSRFVVHALAQHFPDNTYTLFSPKVKRGPDTAIFTQLPNVQIKQPPKLVSSLGLSSYWRSIKLGDIALKNDVQLFHGLSNELPKSKPSNLKTVITVHDLIFKRYPTFYKPIDIRIYDYKLSSAFDTADSIIAISQQTAQDISTYYGVAESRIEVVYQGCHSNFHQVHDQSELEVVRQKYQLPNEYLLNVGTLEDRKNALVILKAMRQGDSAIPIVFVGRATAYTERLKEFAKEHQLQDRVLFIHHADFADLPAIYQMASLFIYPSLFEGFGIPIVEAIASGVPVIAANTSCLTEAGGAASAYFDPHDDQALASLIIELLGNEEMRTRMISDSRTYIQRFEPKQIATDLMSIYTKLI